VELSIEQGEFVAVLGRSGAGKSTLLRCITGALVPSGGELSFEGQRVDGLRGGAALREHRRRIGMVFQQFHLVERLPVLTNVLAGRLGFSRSPGSWFRRFPAADVERAWNALAHVGLPPDLAWRRADQLSGGQQQRVAIARALCQEPHVLLADEPIASLDPVSSREVMDVLARIHREDGMTVIANLHDVAVARRYAQRVVGLAGGRVVFDGKPQELDDAAVARIYGAALGEVA
jgi:phosphonate transport system ATP-binding protein